MLNQINLQSFKMRFVQTGVEEFKVAEFEMLPQTDIELSEADQVTFEKLIDALEDLEDVQNVFHNVDLK